RLTKLLQKTGQYDALIETLQDLGLNIETLENIEEVKAKLLQTWNGPKAPAHTLITLLETIQKRKQTEKQLEKIRTKGATIRRY
ncbi:MAG: hypothetical protein QXF61_04620, partial [Nitrososphaeria archaeon]